AAVAAAAARIRDVYNDYVGGVSAPDMAVSLEAAATLLVLGEGLHPARVLDLGSGFSSFDLRTAAPRADVWSVDDNAEWLERTKAFLRSQGVADKRCELWQTLDPAFAGIFDLVLYDLGSMATRAACLR